MERGESILDAIFDEDNFEDVQDIDMMDLEEGELVGQGSEAELGQNIGDVQAVSQECGSQNNKKRNRKKNKKRKNRGKKGSSGPNVIDIDRFVLDVCRHLKEKKTYLVYTAVGRLGVSVLDDLIKEVDAIQACGGQKTADGRRFKYGGGILWSILKTRDPNAYEEIMRKGKEFEKQFRQQNIRQPPVQNKEATPQRTNPTSTNQTLASASDGSQLAPEVQNKLDQTNVGETRISVRNRLRFPVTYDDLLGEEDPKNQST